MLALRVEECDALQSELASVKDELATSAADVQRLEAALAKAGEDAKALSSASGSEREALLAQQSSVGGSYK